MIRSVCSALVLLLVLSCPAAASLSPLAAYAGDWVLDAPASLALAGRAKADQGAVLQRLAERLRLRVESERLVFIRGRREDALTVDAVVPEEGGLRLTGRTDGGRSLVLHLQELPGGGIRLRSESSQVLKSYCWRRSPR